MNIGKACAIFDQINSDKYTEQEKLNAIKQVIEMPTHNGVTKDTILNAFRWFFDWAVEESIKWQTNADRIRSMSDEELAEFLCNVNQYSDMQVPSKEEINVMLGWLRSEVEE